MTQTKSLPDLLSQLAQAQQAYIDADRNYNVANSEKTHRLNELNAAQKAMDEAFQSLRNGAPHGTDWQRPTPMRETVLP